MISLEKFAIKQWQHQFEFVSCIILSGFTFFTNFLIVDDQLALEETNLSVLTKFQLYWGVIFFSVVIPGYSIINAF